MVYSILKFLAAVISKVLFRVKVYGVKYIPKKGGFILVSNHLSFLDPIILGGVSPRKLNFMARSDLFFHPLFSWLLFKVGAFPIKRGAADLSALKEAIRRVKDNGGLLLFPEGTRGDGSQVYLPQPGIGFLAQRLSAPVIPVFIRGSEKALPRGAVFIRPKKISVYFGKEIFIERRMPYQETAQRIMENIRHLSCQLQD